MKKGLANIVKQYGIGGPIDLGDYNAVEWRDARPVWDRERCFKCGICCLSCPDAAILPVDEGFYDLDPEKCKGCGICAAECLNEAITMEPEEK